MKQYGKHNRIEYDGARGWLVVFAAFMTHFITHGIVYSYGILFLALEDVFGVSKAEMSWIASITTGSLYLSGPLASTFLRRHGSRMVASTGSILSFIGCLLTLFAPNLYFMYFSLGFLTGVGYGLIFLPAVVEVTMYFKKHRALACGIAVSGAGAGAFVFSPLIERLLDAYAWRGTLLICSGLLLNCVPCSLIFRNTFIVEKVSKRSKGETTKLNDYLDITIECVDSNSNDAHATKMYSKVFQETENEPAGKIQRKEIVKIKKDISDKIFDTEQELQEASVTQKMLQDNDEKGYSYNKGIGKSLSRRKSINCSRRFCCESPNLSLFQIFQQKEMILFYLAQILFFLGFYFPIIGLPDMAIQYGIEESRAVWIISAIGIATVLGRVVLGYLFDRPFMNSLFLYKVALLVAGVSTALVPLLSSFPALIIYALAFGLSTVALLVAGVSTALVPLLSSFPALIIYALAFGLSTAVLLSQTTVVLVEIIGMEKMSNAMGLNNMFSGVGALLGPPVLAAKKRRGPSTDHCGTPDDTGMT